MNSLTHAVSFSDLKIVDTVLIFWTPLPATSHTSDHTL